MKEMTLTEALATLVVANKKIEKKTSELSKVASVKVGKKLPTGYKTEDEFNKDSISLMQSLNDLITERNKIKIALAEANANTKLTIAGKEYTIVGAIERKNSIAMEKRILSQLTSTLNSVNRLAENNNQQAEQKLQQLLLQNFGKDTKANENDIEAISKPFWENNKSEVLDPLNLKKLIQALQDSIDAFESEVNTKLVITNSTTTITI